MKLHLFLKFFLKKFQMITPEEFNSSQTKNETSQERPKLAQPVKFTTLIGGGLDVLNSFYLFSVKISMPE